MLEEPSTNGGLEYMDEGGGKGCMVETRRDRSYQRFFYYEVQPKRHEGFKVYYLVPCVFMSSWFICLSTQSTVLE